jgi:transcriptional regulator with XRE-family HTH domain
MVLHLSLAFESIEVATSRPPFKSAGRNLSEIRVRKGLTQEKAAELIGISLKYYQALEGGTKAPAFVTLCRLRRIMDATWDELLDGC